MRLYHRTTTEAAKSVLATGFRDGTDTYMTRREYSGVWLSDVPLDENEGAFGDVVLLVDIPLTDGELAAYEWVEEQKPYREFLVPALVANRAGLTVLSDEEVEDASVRWLQERGGTKLLG